MYIALAFIAAFFAGITTILCKIGMEKVDSNVATLFRTIIVFLFTLLIIGITGTFNSINDLKPSNYLFLSLSGLATGVSWICYYRALKIGNINNVVVIDKFSTVLTMILAFIFLGEKIAFTQYVSLVLLTIGTILMLVKLKEKNKYKKRQYIYAILSCAFASINNILAKDGLANINSNVATGYRTLVVIFMALLIVLVTKKTKSIKTINKKSWIFIILSGLTTCISWVCYYNAMQLGQVSVVVPIDKLSIVVTIFFSFVVYKEKLNLKSLLGLFFIVIGTLILLL